MINDKILIIQNSTNCVENKCKQSNLYRLIIDNYYKKIESNGFEMKKKPTGGLFCSRRFSRFPMPPSPLD